MHARCESFGLSSLGLFKRHVALTALGSLDIRHNRLISVASGVILGSLCGHAQAASDDDDDERGDRSLARQHHAWTMTPGGKPEMPGRCRYSLSDAVAGVVGEGLVQA